MQKLAILPHSLTCIRIVTLPLFYLLQLSRYFFVVCLFILVSSTDLIDGYLARRLNIHSEAGAFFDSIVDFTLILGMFPLFIDAELYPLWIAGVIIFAFTVHFLESFIKKTRSSRKILRQRPLQCGSINDNFPNPLLCNIVVISFVIFSVVSIKAE